MHRFNRFLLLLIGPFLLNGCGGIGDSISEEQLNLHVSSKGRNLSEKNIIVAMRMYSNAPFVERQPITLNQTGDAAVSFKIMTGSAFFVVPPIGSDFQRPPKPTFEVIIGSETLYVSPTTSGAVYTWRNHSWHANASINVK